MKKGSLMRILILATAALMASVSSSNGQSYEVVPLPKTTLEHVLIVDGKNKKNETQHYLGSFALPYITNPASRGETPPYGHRQEIKKEQLLVGDKKHETTCISWILKKPDDFANFDARQITFWVSDQIHAPAFLLPMKLFPFQRSPGLPLPEGIVRFEYLPRDKPYRGDPEGDRKMTIRGVILGKEEIALSSHKISVFKYSFESSSAQGEVKGEFWLSRQVAGGLYRFSAQFKSSKLLFQVKAIGLETVPPGLHKVPAGEFAFAIPKGWKLDKLRSKDEVVRLVPDAVDPEQRSVTIVMKSAGGIVDVHHWMTTLYENGKTHAAAFDPALGLADAPTFIFNRWRAAKNDPTTIVIGGVKNDRLYLIAHRQEHAEGDEGEETIHQLVHSWRWLVRKSEKPDH